MLYTDLQKEEIEKGKLFGLLDEEIKLYAKPYFSVNQMREIRTGLEEGLGYRNVKTYAHLYYSHHEMAIRRQRIRDNDGLEERVHNKWFKVIALSILNILIVPFSLYSFYYSLFTNAPILKMDNELVSAKCGEIIDISSFVTSNADIEELNQFNNKIPGTYLLAYIAKENDKTKMKSLRIQLTDNRPPEIILKEDEVKLDDPYSFECKDYIDSVKDNVSNDNLNVGCSNDLNPNLEEQDILYSAQDKYGNIGYAKLTVKLQNSDTNIIS